MKGLARDPMFDDDAPDTTARKVNTCAQHGAYSLAVDRCPRCREADGRAAAATAMASVSAPAVVTTKAPAQPAAVAVALRTDDRVPQERNERRDAAFQADERVARPLPPQLQRQHRRRQRLEELEAEVAPQHPEHDLQQGPARVGERAHLVDLGRGR